MLGDRKTVVLRGGAPWGFRLSGGNQTPIYIAKVRSRSKAAFGGLAAGDTIISINGIPSLQHTLREINDIIDTVRDQLIIEVQSTTNTRNFRLDSSSSIDTRENSPVRLIQRITPQPRQMDYHQYTSSRTTPTYPSNTNYFNNTNSINGEQYFLDSYGRSTPNPLPSIFRTATITTNSPSTPITTARVQQFSYRPSTSSNSTYDIPRNYNGTISSGYLSDTNDLRRSSISVRPMNGTTNNIRHTTNQQPYLTPSSSTIPTYNTKISTGTEQNYYSDSEYVTSGPRYYKITRQVNTNRRPSNVVLPIRSIISKAYDQYVPTEQPQVQQQQQQIFDVYRYQQEQQRERQERERQERERQERERQEHLQRKLYQQQQQQQQQQALSTRFNSSPKITLPSQTTIDHEIGAELLKSPIANKKRYGDSSFFKTPFNTYPTIEEQKQMARKIASILEGGDPTQKGSTKFEKQRQRVEKYTIESDTTNYRPLRPLQTNDSLYSSKQQQQQKQQKQSYYNSSDIPDCIKHSLEEAQYINPLRYVGAPEEFKQIHMQEHVTHTNVPPQAAMSLVADLNQNRSKGAALFQKRKARSEKWIIDENNVKKQGYQATSNYIGPTTKPWGQRAPSCSDSEGPSFSPVRPTFNPSSSSILPEPTMSPTPPTQTVPRYGDFNAKPKGFNTWHSENLSPRGSIDARKPLNLNIEPSIREGIAESHTRSASQPWSPPNNSQSIFSPNQQQTTTINHFNYPSENLLSKWTNQDYSSRNQSKIQDQRQSQIPMTHDGIDNLRQRLMQPNQSYSYMGFNQRSSNNANPNIYPLSQQRSQYQQQNFTDL
ncbi:unnamed protein product [Rotaria sordida]|uniref:PDZ domain-containing protein n=1 Tax=Rotaria sordida TaxID=392033 RepID=A0A814VCM9_9BILA|nr:unnamed protein product [Rotaria sordida]